MCEEQKGNIVHEGSCTSTSVLHSDKEGKFATQVACGSCFQTIPNENYSLRKLKQLLKGHSELCTFDFGEMKLRELKAT